MKKNTLTVGLLAFLATTALGQAKLKAIETTKVGNGLEIAIQGEGLSNPRTSRILGNTSFIVEFDAKLAGKPTYTKIGEAGVKYVQTVWYRAKPPVVRVHVKTTADAVPTLAQINGQWVVLIGITAAEAGASNPTTAPVTTVTSLGADDKAAMADAIKQLANPTETTGQVLPARTTTPMTVVTGTANAKATVEIPTDTVHGTIASLATDTKPKTTTPTSNTTTVQNVTAVSTPPMKLGTKTNVLDQMVSLDFVGTDIVQILKALSIQAGVNIVTSPDTSPSDKPLKLTISLKNVNLDNALAYVTAMGNLRYARIGNTFVVTPSASFSNAMRQIMERDAESYQTRVVNLMSGEAEKIKEATLKALPPDGRNGFYEIIVPGQNPVGPSAPDTSTQAPAGAGDTQGAPKNPGDNSLVVNPNAPTNSMSRAFYLMVVGDPERLASVENYIRDLDAKVAASFSLSRSSSTSSIAIPIQSGQTEKIKSMIEQLLHDNPRKSDYSITETSVKELDQGEQSIQFLLMIGPDTELPTLKTFAINLDRELCKPLGIAYSDNPDNLIKDYEVVELQYLEPIVAAQDLKGRFKDLWVTVVPDPVTPGITGSAQTNKQEAPTDNGGQGAKPAGNSSQDQSKLTREVGHEPMRLILRGSKSTIADAKAYLAKVDMAPRQIALELRVMDLSKEEALKAGINWNLGLGGTGTVTVNNAPTGTSGSVKGSIGSLNVTAALDSISNNHNLIARPNALVSDGRTAHLFVGDTVRYIKQVQTSQNGTTVITDEVQVGSTFDIKARIGNGGAIALDLTQDFSLLTGFTDVPGGGKLPQTSDRTSNMFVNMKSGETIAIGGLILDQDVKNYSGIPFLKDIPIIGRLFGHTDNDRTRTEIVFFLTAVEVDASNRATAASPRVNESKNPDPIGEYKKTGKNKR